MYNTVFGGESGLCKLGVYKIDCVGDRRGICCGVNNFETTVAFKGGSDIESVVSPVITRFLLGWIVVYGDVAAYRTHGSGGKSKGAVEMLPCGHERIEN